MGTCIRMAESLHYSSETITSLISYTLIQNKKFKRKKVWSKSGGPRRVTRAELWRVTFAPAESLFWGEGGAPDSDPPPAGQKALKGHPETSWTHSVLGVMPKGNTVHDYWNTPKNIVSEREKEKERKREGNKMTHEEAGQNGGTLFLWILWCRMRCELCLKLSPQSRHL